MADYYPLIARAVGGLEKNTGENRRVLYERARTALVNQLRGVEPALEESDITRERLALEESIRKVEAEASKRSRLEASEAAESEADDTTPSLRDQGLRDFRNTVAEAQGLGDAAAEANRSAHASYEAIQDEPPPDVSDLANRAEPYFEPPAEPPADEPPVEPTPTPEPEQAHDAPPAAAHDEPPFEPWPPPPLPPSQEGDDDDAAYPRPQRNFGRIVKIALLLLVIGGIAGAGYWQRDAITAMVANLRSPAPAPKPNAANAPAASVAQKVVLYDEDSADPQGKRYVGSAIWRTETVSPGPGLAPELAVRADVEIPERHLRMTWSLRRNTDKALPASHTIA